MRMVAIMDAADEANGDYNVDHAHDDEMQRRGRLSPYIIETIEWRKGTDDERGGRARNCAHVLRSWSVYRKKEGGG